MKTNLLRMAVAFAVAVLCSMPIAQAQTVTGTITGTVTDPSGAVVAGAKVVAHDLDTGVDTPTTANATGFYRIPFLPIGQYEVTVDASGFGKQTVPAFQLEVLQTPNFNVKLTVGGSSTTVEVATGAPILNTNDASLGSTFTENTIANFPLNGLDFSALTLYIPGAVTTYGAASFSSTERDTYNSDIPNINGNRAQANNYTLDGIDINETFNNLISYSPAPAALEEIKVLTADTPADYGNVNGGGIVSVLKSGSNKFHGSAYGYLQDYRFNANSWQNGNVAPPSTPTPINPFSQDQFGGTLGGPIKRDKLFFFVDYLGSRHHTGGFKTASVFTQAMRNGDFSALLANGYSIQLYDSESTATVAGKTVYTFTPFAGDQNIPILNPVAKYLFANPDLYPLPNTTPSDGLVANNYRALTRSYNANNQGDIKIEYDPRAKDKFTGFFAISTAFDNGNAPVLEISFPSVNLYPTKLFGTNWVHTFSPSLINSARIGFTRTVWNQGFPTDPSGKFGTKGDSVVGIPFPNQSFNGFTNQGITGLSGVGTPAYDGGIIDNTYSYIDNITWQRGRHLLSMGVQALRYQNNYPTGNNGGYLGTLSYSGKFTSDPNAANAGGYGGADFVLDRVNNAQATLSSNNVGQRQWRAAWFINDDFKILPNLTLNLGVRYQYDEPWVEQNNKTGNIDIPTGQVLYAHQIPVGAPAGSGYCKTRGCYDGNFRQIVPRIGFAWQATNRFVVRAGYGASSFYEGNSYNQRLTSITPFIQAVNLPTVAPSAKNGGTPRTAEDGFQVLGAGGTQYGGSYNVYPTNIQPAFVQEWSLTTEYALSRTLSIQAGYVGEQGQHIEDYGNINQWLVNGDETSAPYYNNQYLGVNSPYGVGSGSLLITESRAMMNYNAMQAVLRQRATHGLEYTINYTYGKAMTNSFGNYGLNVSGYNGAFENYYNSAADYGPAGYDITHNVSGTGVYALPVGRGHEYLSGVNSIGDELIGGWKLSASGVAYTGFPETVTADTSNNSNSYGTQRANQYRQLKIRGRNINNWFGDDPSAVPCTTPGVDNGVCAFGVPASNTFGTSSNGAFRGPGYFNMDMSAFKDFHIYGEHSVGFRFDAFNAFNIVSYGNPDTDVSHAQTANGVLVGGSLGQIGPQNNIRSTERHLQFSAHYNF